MPLLFVILFIILVAMVGFWDALGAVLGAVGLAVLAVLVVAGILVLGFYTLMNRRRGR